MTKSWCVALLLAGATGATAVACTEGGPDPAAAKAAAAAFEPYACGDAEVHLFGIDDASARTLDVDTGTESLVPEATVQIDRVGMHYIVLTARHATRWHVIAGNADVQLDAVYVLGAPGQIVDAPANVRVFSSDDPSDPVMRACAMGAGCDKSQVDAFVQRQFGTLANSQHLCLHASKFTLRGDMTAASDCEAATPRVETRACIAPQGADDPSGPSCGGPPPQS